MSARIQFRLVIALAFLLSAATIGFVELGFMPVAFCYAILLVVGICVCVSGTFVGTCLLFVYLGWDGFAKVSTNYPPVLHVGYELLWIAMLLSSWIRNPNFFRDIFLSQVAFYRWCYALVAIVYFAALGNRYSLGFLPWLACAKMYLLMPLLFFFSAFLVRSELSLWRVIQCWLAVAMAQVISSLHQIRIGPEAVMRVSSRMAKNAQFVAGNFRPFGMMAVPGAPCVYLYLTAPFLAGTFYFARGKRARCALWGIAATWSFLLIQCSVRSAMLKAILSISLFYCLLGLRVPGGYLLRLRKVGAIFLFLALTIGEAIRLLRSRLSLGAPFEPPDALLPGHAKLSRLLSLFEVNRWNLARVGAAERVLEYAKRFPFGAGLGRTGAAAGAFLDRNHEFPIPAEPYRTFGIFTDNFWAATIVDLGIIGSLVITIWSATALITSLNSLRRGKPAGVWEMATACALWACFLGLWGSEGFLYNPEASFFWFFSGALVRLARTRAGDKSTGPLAS